MRFSSLKKKKQRLVMLAPEVIISCVLKFIENLLNIDNELDDEDITIENERKLRILMHV